MNQNRMFPPTVEELLAQYRRRLEDDLERAADRWAKAGEKKDDALDALAAFDAAISAHAAVPPIGVEELLPVNELEEAADADPFSGELTVNPLEEADDQGSRPCPECHGEGRLPDRTGGGHHRCRNCRGTGSVPSDEVRASVTVHYDGGSIVLPVGERTRFAALIYAVAKQFGIKDVSEPEWIISADEDGSEVLGKHIITADDHGRAFVVERRP